MIFKAITVVNFEAESKWRRISRQLQMRKCLFWTMKPFQQTRRWKQDLGFWFLMVRTKYYSFRICWKSTRVLFKNRSGSAHDQNRKKIYIVLLLGKQNAFLYHYFGKIILKQLSTQGGCLALDIYSPSGDNCLNII